MAATKYLALDSAILGKAVLASVQSDIGLVVPLLGLLTHHHVQLLVLLSALQQLERPASIRNYFLTRSDGIALANSAMCTDSLPLNAFPKQAGLYTSPGKLPMQA
jgi:hypothetical protein